MNTSSREGCNYVPNVRTMSHAVMTNREARAAADNCNVKTVCAQTHGINKSKTIYSAGRKSQSIRMAIHPQIHFLWAVFHAYFLLGFVFVCHRRLHQNNLYSLRWISAASYAPKPSQPDVQLKRREKRGLRKTNVLVSVGVTLLFPRCFSCQSDL